MSEGTRRLAVQLFGLHPARHQWPAAVQAALAVAVPPLLGLLFGRLEWGQIASIGSLIVLHLPDRSRRERAVALPVIAAALVGAAWAGTWVGAALLPSLLAMAVVAAGGSFLAQALSVGPPGALFLVLVTGSAGQLVAPTASGGAGLPVDVVIGALAAGSTMGYVVIVAPLLIPSIRHADADAYATRRPWTFSVTTTVRVVSVRIAVAAAISVAACAALGLHHAAWVLLACLGILQKDADIRSAMLRGTQRLLGTAVAIALVLGLAFIDPTGVERVAWAAALIFAFELLLRRNLTWALAVVTPMAVLLASASDQSIAQVAGERAMDTVVGAIIAGAVLFGAALVQRQSRRDAGAHDTAPGR